MEPIISVKKLSVIYDQGLPAETTALKNVALDVYPEEFLVIFGPSGCGKSTLLYAISGIERRIAEGEIYVRGKELKSMSRAELIRFHREDIGMIFQAYNLIPTLNVAENIVLPLIFHGVPPDVRGKRGGELLERFGIAPLAGKFPQFLSGGQQQRVGIARALINDPAIILADEPTGNLDSASAYTVMDTLTELNLKNKKTVILVTHEAQYLPYATRIVYMKDGEITKETRQERHGRGGAGEGGGHGGSVEVRVAPLEVLSHFGLRIGVEEYPRFESILGKFIQKKITKDEFASLLDLSFDEGGIGLYRQRARRLADALEEVRELADTAERLEKDPDGAARAKARWIARWLVRGVKAEPDEAEQKRIEELVLERARNRYSITEFRKQLSLPENHGGAGLRSASAKRIAEKLELIL